MMGTQVGSGYCVDTVLNFITPISNASVDMRVTSPFAGGASVSPALFSVAAGASTSPTLTVCTLDSTPPAAPAMEVGELS